ncbi:MAG: ABC transporter permease [Armatimonadetes bacterium]|nr:ABC transporter permease [Armatimonadota bacterium]
MEARSALSARGRAASSRRPAPARGRVAIFFRLLRRNRAAVGGGIVILAIILLTLLAPVVAPYPYQRQDFSKYLAPPARAHLFGTDEQGRDILSRVIYGGRVSLPLGLIAVSIAAVFGFVFGATAGYFGGWTDTAVMRGMDIMLAFPTILLALAIITILGPGVTNTMIAVGISAIPVYTRVVRGTVLSVKQMEYVSAAQAVGASRLRIIARHILPNSFAPVMVLATTGTATAIITSAALSFIGLGAQPPTPEWGSLLSSGREYLRHAPWMSIFPGLAIMVAVMAINLLGDGLRDALDPRLR